MPVPADIPVGIHTRVLGPGGTREVLGAGWLKKRPGHDHRDFDPVMYSLVYVVTGNGTYTDHRQREHPLAPGSWFQRIPGYQHSTFITEGEPWIEVFLDLGPRMTEALIDLGQIDPDRPVGIAGTGAVWVDEFATLIRSVIAAKDEDLRRLLPPMLDLQQRVLGGGNAETDSDDDRLVREARALLETDLDRRLDLRALCRERSWGYERFRKLFQQATGVAPGQYRIRKRLDAARNLIVSRPDLTIAQIADRLGYASPFELSAQCKRHLGMAPSRFRPEP